MSKFYFSSTKQKMLLLLLAGTTLAFTSSPRMQRKIIKNLPRAWRDINRKILYRRISEFYKDRLVDFRVSSDGTSTVILTDRGEKYALRYKIEALTIPPQQTWDKKWRIVIFDIPEKYKHAREALRKKLQELGFYQLQKSAWLYPYPCKEIIEFIIEIFEIRPYVQYLEVTNMTFDAKIRLYFKLE